ncbi:squalene--hopene cyclase [Metabacillus sp. 84]|uniref:terpene cyclase/mutase family protein n=1 Tax=Metabacillus sp. 84 TaxID=3404705 RepID=UPI003CE963CE
MIREAEQGRLYLAEKLRKEQLSNGSWDYLFDTGIKTDCFMIVLIRSLNLHDFKLTKPIAERIAGRQEQDGSWRLFHDQEDGDLSTAIEAYYALILSGYYAESSPQMVAAREFILSKGGIKKAGLFTKILLALTSQESWPALLPVPVEAILLPKNFPVNMYDISVYGRANLVPILVAAGKKFQLEIQDAPDLSCLKEERVTEPELYRSGEWRGIFSLISSGVQSMAEGPGRLKEAAFKKAETYMLSRLESDGTLYSYFSCTFLMIYALMALGYEKTHPVIVKAVRGLAAMAAQSYDGVHMQYTTAHIWNTSLLSCALQEAGVKDEMVKRANRYLLVRQHSRFGDWVIHNPQGIPGGWGFSDINSMNPDVDDTCASLRAIQKEAASDPLSLQAWKRGLNWVLSMQNGDGGWASFERNANPPYVHFIPISRAEFIISDASSADLTGRTIEFLCGYAEMDMESEAVAKGIQWLLNNQERDGSWKSRWGICYIYGTWAALTGLRAAGYEAEKTAVRRARKWLETIQNRDGGWGESCKSDVYSRYIPLGASTLTHTAWALEALICCTEHPSSAIEKGMGYLLSNLNKTDWTSHYPKGQGFAGQFYIHYHSYDLIFPLLAISKYLKWSKDRENA